MQELLAECRAQDEVLRGAGLEIWLGAEPTFTDRALPGPALAVEGGGGRQGGAGRRAPPGAARGEPPAVPPFPASSAPSGRLYAGGEDGSPRFCLGAA